MTSTECLLQAEEIQAVSNGVFGEYLQGMGADNQHFLVTSPVNIYSTAIFRPDSNLEEIRVVSQQKSKSQQLANKLYERYGLKTGGTIRIDTRFSIGKGLGSSSADLVAVAHVLSNAYGLNITPPDIEDLIRGIEPTDGIMYPGSVSYYYKRVKLNKELGSVKGLMIVGIDEGGEIDTVAYNQVKRVYDLKTKRVYDLLHAKIERAIVRNDIFLLGEVATQSSLLNQKFNPKKLLEEALRIKECFGLPGVIIAHSGTYIGFLIDCRTTLLETQLNKLEKVINALGYTCQHFYAQ